MTVDLARLPRPPRRLRVLVLFGGRSSEHEVSCLSARSVVAALEGSHHEVICVGITREGRWSLVEEVPTAGTGLPAVSDDGDTVALAYTRKGPRLVRFGTELTAIDLGPIDVCFPVLHGPYGEDGTVQGHLASHGVPYVGADVASSAIGIDKRQMKHVFAARGLPQVPYLAVRRAEWEADRDGVVAEITRTLGEPRYTKPARQGSSIGIRRVAGEDELVAGIEEAFTFDRVAIVEQALDEPRELECGVLGNAEVHVTRPGETVHTGAFYDFDAKYLAPVELRCPADVPEEVAAACVAYAREAYLAIGARGMARVDFFWVPAAGRVLVNEINTIPGLTPSSMFPPVWEAEGLAWPDLVECLLGLALDAAARDARYAP